MTFKEALRRKEKIGYRFLLNKVTFNTIIVPQLELDRYGFISKLSRDSNYTDYHVRLYSSNDKYTVVGLHNESKIIICTSTFP